MGGFVRKNESLNETVSRVVAEYIGKRIQLFFYLKACLITGKFK
jgi:ADP-ribose pyrophosphatase YjhB (NUDIX family)